MSRVWKISSGGDNAGTAMRLESLYGKCHERHKTGVYVAIKRDNKEYMRM
jgi:hypothetical protein